MRPTSITEPTSASISGSRPASTSCSIEVLCLPTRSAPAMRFSSVTRKVMPSRSATACASRIIAAARSRVSGNWQMSTSVECVSALIGLKVRLPHSLSQISERMLSSTGALRPARAKVCGDRVHARRCSCRPALPAESGRLRCGAPRRARRVRTRDRRRSRCRRRGSTAAAIAPSGSTLVTTRARRIRRRGAGNTTTECRSASG